MNERPNESGDASNADGDNVRDRSATLRGGHDPAELGKKSGEARRERAAARARAQEHDRLTVAARLALALATDLTYAELHAVIARTVRQAKEADGHVQIQAARTVIAWHELAARGGDDDEVDPIDDLASLTPEQRAVYRSVRERALREMEELASDDHDHQDGDG
jgi:hypothetical protein